MLRLVEHRGMLDSSNESMREEMYGELHSDLASTYGFNQGGARLVQIVSLVEDILVRGLPGPVRLRLTTHLCYVLGGYQRVHRDAADGTRVPYGCRTV